MHLGDLFCLLVAYIRVIYTGCWQWYIWLFAQRLNAKYMASVAAIRQQHRI